MGSHSRRINKDINVSKSKRRDKTNTRMNKTEKKYIINSVTKANNNFFKQNNLFTEKRKFTGKVLKRTCVIFFSFNKTYDATNVRTTYLHINA